MKRATSPALRTKLLRILATLARRLEYAWFSVDVVANYNRASLHLRKHPVTVGELRYQRLRGARKRAERALKRIGS